MTDIYEDSTYPDPVIRMPQTTQVRLVGGGGEGVTGLRGELAASVASIIAPLAAISVNGGTHADPSTHKGALLIHLVVELPPNMNH